MQKIGFSTGALAKGDLSRGVDLQREHALGAIELSALREEELERFFSMLGQISLTGFQYISVHAPSRLSMLTEEKLCEMLHELPAAWPVIVHPDLIRDVEPWKELGSRVCIENMDERKSIGQRAEGLEPLMTALPDAGFCLDLAHAGQIDPSMAESIRFLDRFGERLVQLHVSRLGPASEHLPLDESSSVRFGALAGLIDPSIPIIIEAVVPESRVSSEIEMVREVFGR